MTANPVSRTPVEPSEDFVIGLINLVTDLADGDALDRAIPEVRAYLTALQSPQAEDGGFEKGWNSALQAVSDALTALSAKEE